MMGAWGQALVPAAVPNRRAGPDCAAFIPPSGACLTGEPVAPLHGRDLRGQNGPGVRPEPRCCSTYVELPCHDAILIGFFRMTCSRRLRQMVARSASRARSAP